MFKKTICLLLAAMLAFAMLGVPAQAEENADEEKWISFADGVGEVRFYKFYEKTYPEFKVLAEIRLTSDGSTGLCGRTVSLENLIKKYISSHPEKKGRKIDASEVNVKIFSDIHQLGSTSYDLTFEISLGDESISARTCFDLANLFPNAGFMNYEAYNASKCIKAILKKKGNPSNYNYTIGDAFQVYEENDETYYKIPLTIRNEFHYLYACYTKKETVYAIWGDVAIPGGISMKNYPILQVAEINDVWVWGYYIYSSQVTPYLK